jgi:hypothetical protein
VTGRRAMTCPLRRFAIRLHRDTCASPHRCLPLMKLTALQSVVGIVVAALSGYAAPTDASPFLADRGGLPRDTGPRFGEETGSSSRELGSPPEFVVPASARLTGRLPWGLSPLRDISPASPLPTSIPGSSMFRPQRFTRSRRLAPRQTLQTCFILLPRPGFLLQGFPPPT